MDSLDDSYSLTGFEPNAYDLMETYVESYTESLTTPQFSKQGFLEDVEYDDTALEDMLREAHRVHVYHSQREGLSVGQSSSSVSERTGRPVGPMGQELNVANAQVRTLLDRQKERMLAECQAEIKEHEFQRMICTAASWPASVGPRHCTESWLAILPVDGLSVHGERAM